MKLVSLRAIRYRSLRDEEITLTDLNLFIGSNASGKSTILDALRFLHEGVQERDFKPPVFSRGGIVHVAWKGEEARQIEIQVRLEDDSKTYEWSIRLTREGYDFSVHEDVSEFHKAAPPSHLLSVDKGRGWWWSGTRGDRVSLAQPPTTCALAAAAVDESFPARCVAEFVSRWGFFDPSPFLLRRGWTGLDSSRFDPYGRNLAERLFALKESSPDAFEQIISATQSVLGLPSQLDLRESRESEDRVYFVQHEPGLMYPVHQVGASSGTLRMLALMTAIFGETGSNLIGIEEPENHVHPTAEVRIPPGGKALDVKMAEKLLKASWFERLASPPDKFVILVDSDGKTQDDALRPFREQLAGRMGTKIQPQLQFACAQWHLEAWYFADSTGLRDYLERDLGSVDTSNPDEIQNPKLHLKNLLGKRAYTAVVSEEIAKTMNPLTICQRSPSFQGFLAAVRNGSSRSQDCVGE